MGTQEKPIQGIWISIVVAKSHFGVRNWHIVDSAGVGGT